MRAKICGIKNHQDAKFSADHGAWAIGFNFYSKSPRYISETLARSIMKTTPNHVLKIGIVPFIAAEEIEPFMYQMELDVLQVYEDVDVEPFVKRKMVLALCVDSTDELPRKEILEQYGYLLLDAPRSTNALIGGTGRLSNWDIAHCLSQSYRLILAGGLTPHNVKKAIQTVHPFAVDVASGVESYLGKKSPILMKQFLSEVNDVT